LIVIGASGAFSVIVHGDEGHEHDHGDAIQGAEEMQLHDAEGNTATHQHAEWAPPPAEYLSRTSKRWADIDAFVRGREIYENVCVVCHGVDGRGTGQMAAGLSHPPADLTSHFHTGPGDGDAYLFWRVSEGGVVEPFRSMGSAMPAFKDLLSEDERWDVLTYVHVYFHLGLQRWEPYAAGEEQNVHEHAYTESEHQH